jgi:DNA (cytosine-5)-methyltransferase 1
MSIPIIDLFAGPGGLGEGFSSIRDADGNPAFRIGLSIEKEISAHRTLRLRAAYRQLDGSGQTSKYFEFLRGNLSLEEFQATPAARDAFHEAATEARQYELGKTSESQIDSEIRRALRGASDWVLIGGPPCQAYSLVGRARRSKDATFAADEKHFLYQEYLRIIRQHRPAAFVMENVKGLISSKHSGEPMFNRIRDDLSRPLPDLDYEICSFVKAGTNLLPEDYIIESERYGIPQCRHRVILLGLRRGFGVAPKKSLLKMAPPVSVMEAINDLPAIRSRISRGGDSHAAWIAAIAKSAKLMKGWEPNGSGVTQVAMNIAILGAQLIESTGAAYLQTELPKADTEYRRWIQSRRLKGVTLHEARSHMESDLARYLFASAYASMYQISPRLSAFPPLLLPLHRNAEGDLDTGIVPFNDRFRVQCADAPASTIVSHIAKDGHYYIHYDPAQCRSLTVREAARLQTFPDDYYFLGNRTQQYTQVGNAVPPLLAKKLAEAVFGLMQAKASETLSLIT